MKSVLKSVHLFVPVLQNMEYHYIVLNELNSIVYCANIADTKIKFKNKNRIFHFL